MDKNDYNDIYSEFDTLSEQDNMSESLEFYNKHYIKIREDGAVVDGWSNDLDPNKDTSDAICINDKAGYQFRLVFHEPKTETYIDMNGNEIQGKTQIVETLSEENPLLYDWQRIPIYKYVDGEIVKRTDDEIEEDRKNLPPYLPEVKVKKQEENKKALAKFLSEHPLLWKDGKYYGVTEDDQREMSLNLMQYQLAVGAGLDAKLEWHSAKASCTEWTLQDFTELALAITNYVYPYLRYQESVKEQIYSCETKDEVYAVEINYEMVV